MARYKLIAQLPVECEIETSDPDKSMRDFVRSLNKQDMPELKAGGNKFFASALAYEEVQNENGNQ